MPFRLRGPKLLIVMAFVTIIFGVRRLPEIGGAMGKAIRGFRKGVSGKGEEAVSAAAKRTEAQRSE